MALQLYDSFTRSIRAFEPLRAGQASIYVCGATPQSSPHIGHVRSQVAYDVLRRWLTRSGLQVTLVRNVTDVDDKILARSAEADRPWWAHAYRYEREFDAAYAALNVLPASYQPRATGHLSDMVALIGRLIETGHAYPAADASGDVYFDVRSFPGYGELTRQKLSDLAPAEDVEDAEAAERGRKRDPRDFVLWKGTKAGEPATASWPTPWGAGRPGWHLECSVMAVRYLGREFDIHGGGLDLRFPHHENERAQSLAAGDPFARYWLHNALVVLGGEKMSKSLGNTLTIAALLGQVRPVVLRFLLTAAHYRSNIEIGDGQARAERLAEAAAGFERIENFLVRAAERCGPELTGSELEPVDLAAQALPPAFVAAMDDDLAVPAALAVLHDSVRAGNSALAEYDREAVLGAGLQVRAMADVLGVDPFDPHWTAVSAGADAGLKEALDALVRAELAARAQARQERDFAAADAIRDRLAAAGIEVEDTADGARWSVQALDRKGGGDGR